MIDNNEKQPSRKLGYLVKAFPRISETFILNEILQIEKKGVPLHVYSMIEPKDTKRHRHADEVMSDVTYMPYPLFPATRRLFASHIKVFWDNPLRYCRALLNVAVSFDKDLVERFIQAGYLARVLKNDGINHLHAGFVHAPGSVAWIVHMMTGIPFSVATHAKDLYHSPKKLLRKKFASASLVLTCTKYNVKYLNKTFRNDVIHKLQHVYHGVDLNRFPYGSYGLAPTPLVLTVARLVEKKGLRDLIRACKILHDNGREFQCRIIGEGDLRKTLEKFIKEQNVEGIVSLEGAMDQDEVRKWYRQATVFALPSLITEDGDRDGIPNVLVEAASMGVPIVSTGVSGISELITDNITGLQVPSRAPSELAQAIERLLDSAELRERLRKQARSNVEEKFCLNKNSVTIADRMKSLIGVK